MWVKGLGSTFVSGLGPHAWGVVYESSVQSELSQHEEPLQTPAVVTGKELEVLGKLGSVRRWVLTHAQALSSQGEGL